MSKVIFGATLLLLFAAVFTAGQNPSNEREPTSSSVSICRDARSDDETISPCIQAPGFLMSFLGTESDSWVIGLHSSGGIFGDHFSRWVNSEGQQVCSIKEGELSIGMIDVQRFRQVTTLLSGVLLAPRNNFVSSPGKVPGCNDCAELSLMLIRRQNASMVMSQFRLRENTRVVSDLYDTVAGLPECAD